MCFPKKGTLPLSWKYCAVDAKSFKWRGGRIGEGLKHSLKIFLGQRILMSQVTRVSRVSSQWLLVMWAWATNKAYIQSRRRKLQQMEKSSQTRICRRITCYRLHRRHQQAISIFPTKSGTRQSAVLSQLHPLKQPPQPRYCGKPVPFESTDVTF